MLIARHYELLADKQTCGRTGRHTHIQTYIPIVTYRSTQGQDTDADTDEHTHTHTETRTNTHGHTRTRTLTKGEITSWKLIRRGGREFCFERGGRGSYL